MQVILRLTVFFVAASCMLSANFAGSADAADVDIGGYDPLELGVIQEVEVLDTVLKDVDRGRDIPLRYYHKPGAEGSLPLVIFSHGLGGSRTGSAFLGRHWASRGYVAVFIQHPGSDETVWRDKPMASRLSEMKKAASAKNLLLRAKDVSALIDHLEKWNVEEGHALKSRLDLSRIGMSGHSFGAVTTQALSGQKYPLNMTSYADKRIKAAIMFSPSPPSAGSVDKAFREVTIPCMLMTGTLDGSMITSTGPEDRLKVFPALPPGGKYELVLHKAEHSIFNERRLPGEKHKRNPNHHRAIMALSTAFWDAWLKQDEAAKKWLTSDSGARSVLAPEDRYQFK